MSWLSFLEKAFGDKKLKPGRKGQFQKSIEKASYLDSFNAYNTEIRKITKEIKRLKKEGLDQERIDALEIRRDNLTQARLHLKKKDLKPLESLERRLETSVARDRKRHEKSVRKQEFSFERLIQLRYISKESKIREKQLNSLKPWIDYIRDASYEVKFKYYVLRSILQYDLYWLDEKTDEQIEKEEKENLDLGNKDKKVSKWVHGKRNVGSIKEFPTFDPDIAPGVLGQMRQYINIIQTMGFGVVSNGLIPMESGLAVLNADFRDLYSAIRDEIESTRYKEEDLESREEGRWLPVFTIKGLDTEEEKDQIALKLAKQVQFSRGFCIKGVATARDYLNRGDIYIYNIKAKTKGTKERKTKLINIPEIAIHIIKNHKAEESINPLEIHGNGTNQGIEKEYLPIARKFIAESKFANKDEFELKFADAELLIEVKGKIANIKSGGGNLSARELRFLYEIYRRVETFESGSANTMQILREKRIAAYFGAFNEEMIMNSGYAERKKKEADGLRLKDFNRMFGPNVSEVIVSAGRDEPWRALTKYMSQVINRIKDFKKGRKIVLGSLNLKFGGIKDLGNLEEITGSFFLPSDKDAGGLDPKNKLHSLGKLSWVGGIELTDEDKRKILSGEIYSFPEPEDPRRKKIFY